jgi:acyl-CoA reductase-like NAD-dependent aldehyde dehydrogenase
MGEIFPVCEKLRYTIAHGEHDLKPESREPGILMHKRAWVEYHPVGVVGVIAPWNFPFHNMFCPAIPALFAGNAVVVKVSEWTSWCAEEFAEIFRRALRRRGHSPDLFQVITGYGETGAHLVRAATDKIFFTGSPQNGRKVMEAASQGLTPVVLELGGKDPLIVCDDADLARAADAAMLGVFTACGQMCVGVERIYVSDRVHDQFVQAMTARVQALRQGPPLAAELVDCGAMTMPGQLQIIQELVDDAVQRGARVVVGGARNLAIGPQYYSPTLLVDVTHEMRITQEEVFGPVMVIMRVRDDDHAVELANDCRYGLGSSVFTRNAQRGRDIAARIRAGMTVINDYGIAYMVQSLPFGGVGVSGFGRINGREGLRACCFEKSVVVDRFPVGKSFAIHPIRPHTYDLVESAVRMIYQRGWRARARGLLDADKNLVEMTRQTKPKDHRE